MDVGFAHFDTKILEIFFSFHQFLRRQFVGKENTNGLA